MSNVFASSLYRWKTFFLLYEYTCTSTCDEGVRHSYQTVLRFKEFRSNHSEDVLIRFVCNPTVKTHEFLLYNQQNRPIDADLLVTSSRTCRPSGGGRNTATIGKLEKNTFIHGTVTVELSGKCATIANLVKQYE